MLTWYNAHKANSNVLNPEEFGWYNNQVGKLAPVLNLKDCAPESVLDLVRCGCRKTFCTKKTCKCFSQNLKCTEMCTCGGEEEKCENRQQEPEVEKDNIEEF